MPDIENPPFDAHDSEGAALWLESRARENRVPRSPGEILTRDHCNLLPHFAFRFEQIAELLRKLAEKPILSTWRACADSEDGNHVLKQDGPFSVVYCDACGMNKGFRTDG